MSDVFPQPAGVTLVLPPTAGYSPSMSTLTSNDSDKPHVVTPKRSTFLEQVQDTSTTRSMDRGTPGDAALIAMVQRGDSDTQLSKRRSQFYGEVFAVRENSSSARERITRDSMVMAELRTNVIVDREFDFVTGLSNQMSTRYQRPESSILVSLTHSACLMVAGSFDPAYILTISALPANVQPATNKRNAALIQLWLAENLGVEPARGILRFAAVKEEDLARDGVTVLGEIEALEKKQAPKEQNGSVKRGLIRGRSGIIRGEKSTERLSPTSSSPRLLPPTSVLSSVSEDHQDAPHPPQRPLTPQVTVTTPERRSSSKWDRKPDKTQQQRIGKRKSFMGLFLRQQ